VRKIWRGRRSSKRRTAKARSANPTRRWR
jgi:hypothetical protein